MWCCPGHLMALATIASKSVASTARRRSAVSGEQRASGLPLQAGGGAAEARLKAIPVWSGLVLNDPRLNVVFARQLLQRRLVGGQPRGFVMVDLRGDGGQLGTVHHRDGRLGDEFLERVGTCLNADRSASS
jgi:hypothetical protein